MSDPIVEDGEWRLMSESPGIRHWHLEMPNGDVVIKTEYLVDALIDDNTERLNNSIGQRWGDGKSVANIPLNVYMKELKEASLQHDKKYISKWLNDSNHSKFRTFHGKV